MGETSAQRSIRLVVIFTFQRVLSLQVVYFSLHSTSIVVTYLFLLTLFMLLDSWGLISRLDDSPLLHVEPALVNSSTCQELLSPTNLVGLGLVDVSAGMDNKILSAMSRKRARGTGDSSSTYTPPKKSHFGHSKTPAPALPPPPPRKNSGEKPHDKSPEIST